MFFDFDPGCEGYLMVGPDGLMWQFFPDEGVWGAAQVLDYTGYFLYSNGSWYYYAPEGIYLSEFNPESNLWHHTFLVNYPQDILDSLTYDNVIVTNATDVLPTQLAGNSVPQDNDYGNYCGIQEGLQFPPASE